MQQRKSGEMRRREFLEIALRLFSEKGFDGTTVQDIIDAVGVSKGTFYHYFDSKKEVVEELAQGLAEYTAQLIEEIAAKEDIDAVEKLNRVLTIREIKEEHLETKVRMRSAVGRSGNLYLAQRLIDIMLETCAAPFALIVAQGNRKGVFDVPDVDEAADCLLRMMLTLKQSLPRLEDRSIMRRRVKFYEHAVARVLGASPGSVDLLEPLMRRYRREPERRAEAEAH